MVNIYDKDEALHVNIATHQTGYPNSITDLPQRLAHSIEAAAYEEVRKLVQSSEIPQAVIIWDNQTIRLRRSP